MRSDKKYLTNKERQKAYRERKKAEKLVQQKIDIPIPVTPSVTLPVTTPVTAIVTEEDIDKVEHQIVKNLEKKKPKISGIGGIVKTDFLEIVKSHNIKVYRRLLKKDSYLVPTLILSIQDYLNQLLVPGV